MHLGLFMPRANDRQGGISGITPYEIGCVCLSAADRSKAIRPRILWSFLGAQPQLANSYR